MFRLVCLSIFSILMMSASARADEPELVLFQENGKWYTSEVHAVFDDGSAKVRVHAYHEGYHTFDYIRLPESRLIREVPVLSGVKNGDELCLGKAESGEAQGTNIEVKHVFANGKAEAEVGDFFGSRFWIFSRPVIVDVANLVTCNQRETASVSDRAKKSIAQLGSAEKLQNTGLKRPAGSAR